MQRGSNPPPEGGNGANAGSLESTRARLEKIEHGWSERALAVAPSPQEIERLASEAGPLASAVSEALGHAAGPVVDALRAIEGSRGATVDQLRQRLDAFARAVAALSPARDTAGAPPKLPPMLLGGASQTVVLEPRGGGAPAASTPPRPPALANLPGGASGTMVMPPPPAPVRAPPRALSETLVVPSGLPPAPAPPPAVRPPAREEPRMALPDSLVMATPPQLLGNGPLGLRGFGNPPPEARAPAARASSTSNPPAPLLGLGQGKRTSSQPAAPPPRWPSGPSAAVTGEPPPRARAPLTPGRFEGLGSTPPPGKLPAARSSTSSTPKMKATTPPWFWVAAGGLGLLIAAVVALILVSFHDSGPRIAKGADAAVTPSAAAPPPTSQAPTAAAELHDVAPGGVETKELRALIDTQAKLAAQCRPGAAGDDKCSRWSNYARETPASAGAAPVPHVQVGGPLPPMLQSLKKPRDFPLLRDDPALRGTFEFRTKNIAGRQSFQGQLFNCAAYGDIFDATLAKYGAPLWLKAVVFQESGCDLRATSPTGARGLWQFMPEAARGYGLRVEEDVIDERLNPAKATEAAIHFLTDLQRKFGAWDLALAAYNMGPYGVAGRRARAGGDATFWDLAAAELLPDETAGYVPSIEAYALILENMNRLQFSHDGKRLQSTSELVVKPGTHLSLLARAARTTTDRIVELNPEFLGPTVPQVNGVITARIPETEYAAAKSFLENRAADDDRDQCVPSDFDWGSKPFETSRYAKNCDKLGGAP